MSTQNFINGSDMSCQMTEQPNNDDGRQPELSKGVYDGAHDSEDRRGQSERGGEDRQGNNQRQQQQDQPHRQGQQQSQLTDSSLREQNSLLRQENEQLRREHVTLMALLQQANEHLQGIQQHQHQHAQQAAIAHNQAAWAYNYCPPPGYQVFFPQAYHLSPPYQQLLPYGPTILAGHLASSLFRLAFSPSALRL